MEHYIDLQQHAHLHSDHSQLNQNYNFINVRRHMRTGVKRKAAPQTSFIYDFPYEQYNTHPSRFPPRIEETQAVYFSELPSTSYSHVMAPKPTSTSKIAVSGYDMNINSASHNRSRNNNDKQNSSFHSLTANKKAIGDDDDDDDDLKEMRDHRTSRKRKYASDEMFEKEKCESQQSLRDPRALANDRERQRTQSLNEAFCALRKRIPRFPSDKLSKIQTLRMGRHYIEFLSTLLNSPEVFPPSVMSSKLRDSDIHSLFSLWRIEHDLRDGRTDGSLS